MSDKELVRRSNQPSLSRSRSRLVHFGFLTLSLVLWISYFLGNISLLATLALSVPLFSLWLTITIIIKLVQLFRRIGHSSKQIRNRGRFLRRVSEAGLHKEVERWEDLSEQIRSQRESFQSSLEKYLNPTEITYRRFDEAHLEAVEVVEQRMFRAHSLIEFAITPGSNRDGKRELRNEIRSCLDEAEALFHRIRDLHLELINTFTSGSQDKYLNSTEQLDRLLQRIKNYTEA